MEILYWMGRKLSNKEIADRLCISVYTVKNHVHRILEKLGVNTRLEAVRLAEPVHSKPATGPPPVPRA
jgi:DNA-binding CsgD family transcriptional regulator